MNENERDMWNWWKLFPLNLPNNFCQNWFFLSLHFSRKFIRIESPSQSSWKTLWFILLFPWTYEKRIISVQAPFKVLQCNYFFRSFSLQSLSPPEGIVVFVGKEMKKVSLHSNSKYHHRYKRCCSSYHPQLSSVVLICLHSVKVMKQKQKQFSISTPSELNSQRPSRHLGEKLQKNWFTVMFDLQNC